MILHSSSDAIRLVEEIVPVAECLLCILVDSNDDGLDVLEAVALPRRQAPNIRQRRYSWWIVGILLVVPPQRFSHRHVPLDGTILEHWVGDREFVCDSPDGFSQLRVSNSYEALVTFLSGLRCRAYDFPFQFCQHESFIPSSDADTEPDGILDKP